MLSASRGRAARPSAAPGDWFRLHPGARAPRVRLVCFPHAGGTAQLFHGWPARLPGDVELLAVRYPGRQDRVAEPCIDVMDPLADAVAAALDPYLDRPVALFGHSMGASVAYEVARRLEARGAPVARLLVSARAAPHRPDGETPRELGDEELIARIRELGDLHSEAYDIPELRDLLLPALRADHRLVERYRPADPPPLRAPISGYAGEGDASCPPATVRAWGDLAGPDGFALRAFPGDHFYLVPGEAALLADIAARLA